MRSYLQPILLLGALARRSDGCLCAGRCGLAGDIVCPDAERRLDGAASSRRAARRVGPLVQHDWQSQQPDESAGPLKGATMKPPRGTAGAMAGRQQALEVSALPAG